MQIRRIFIRNFASHQQSEVIIPDNGIVLVTGQNGAGKTAAFIDSVSVALWNRPIRGESLWASENDAFVEVSFDDQVVRRIKNTRSVSIDWKHAHKYENNTKAQIALDCIIGTFEVWRRSHVFSSQDAAHFTMSTDSERKRLLEEIQGLDSIEAASKECSKEYSAINNDLVKIISTRDIESARVEEIQKRIASFVSSAYEDPAIIRSRIKDLEHSISEYNDACRNADVIQAKAQERWWAFSKRVKRLQDGMCPLCGADVDESKKNDLLQEVRISEEKLNEANKLVQDLQDDPRAALPAMLRTCVSDLRAADIGKKFDEERNKAKAEKAASEAKVKSLSEEINTLRHRLSILDKCSEVLGLRGLRSKLLNDCLRHLEFLTNFWLEKLQAAHRIELRSYTDKKGGGTTEAIQLKLSGSGRGYKSASGGERRRIDVAFILALSQLSAYRTGKKPGTIFIDECFDGLDADGVESVIEILSELSADRAVVLITHNQLLARKIRYKLRYDVAHGKITTNG